MLSSVNVDLTSLHVHQMYRPQNYIPLGQGHLMGLEKSRHCLVFDAQGMWSAPSGKGIRNTLV